MKKELKERIACFNDVNYGYMFIDDRINDIRYLKYNYFIKYCNTRKFYKGFKTQKELNTYLKNEGYIRKAA